MLSFDSCVYLIITGQTLVSSQQKHNEAEDKYETQTKE